ncbi:MAG: class I SAM-dependent methyltransferase [Alphaproteobacteria bacterium]|nr:class I SAM-dependent methyltransferase [Alphaproteobacteria bacterium]
MTRLPCRLTGRMLVPFLRLPAIALANKPAAAPAPDAVAPMDLVCDPGTGHVSGHLDLAGPVEPLLARLYGAAYEGKTPPALSPSQVAWNDAVAARIATELPRGARVLEIGAFDGSFLLRLRDRGLRVTGVEPSPVALRAQEFGIEMHLRPFRADDFGAERFDAIVLRHVLEHVPAPLDFLADAARLLAPGGLAYVEVPNSQWSLSAGYLPEFHADHLSYFAPASLLACLRGAELGDAVRIENAFGPMRFPFLCAFARRVPGGSVPVVRPAMDDAAQAEMLARFAQGFARYRRALRALAAAGGIALWGSGAIATQYAIDGGFDAAMPCVDPNPRNHGKRLAVTGNPVLPPGMLRRLRPRIVLIASAWEEDVRRQAGPYLDCGARLLGYDDLLAREPAHAAEAAMP